MHHQQSNHQDITIIGIDEWRKCMEEFLTKYPDYQEKIFNQMAESDKVVTILECGASAIKWSGVTIDQIRDGKSIETWVWFKRTKKV